MTDYRTQPINQKNADFVEQVAEPYKKCNWKAAAYGKMQNAVFSATKRPLPV